MKIQLDHIQRLNLHALLGSQRGDVATIRALWALQDKLALSSDEDKAIELKREIVAGQERTIWNPSLSIAPRDFEFSDSEAARIKTALEAWSACSASSDRRLLEPLLRALVTQ